MDSFNTRTLLIKHSSQIIQLINLQGFLINKRVKMQYFLDQILWIESRIMQNVN